MKPRSILCRFFCLALLAVALGGCITDDLFSAAHYTVSGLPENDARLQKDLDAVVKTRVDAIEKAKDKEEQARQEAYQENLIQADLLSKMNSEGYYDAKVDFKADKDKPWTGTYTVRPGALYTIKSITVQPGRYLKMMSEGRTAPGMPLDAAAILKVQADTLKAISKDQCYFNLDITNDVTLDKNKKTGAVVFVVTAGPQAKFGHTTFTGNGNVHLSYLYKMLPWKEGDCFDRTKIESYRASLLSAGLFSSAEIKLPPAPAADGLVPMEFTLKERVPRSISAGLSYYTDQGVGATFGWTHRNLFGNGETLVTTATVSHLIQNLTATLTKPFFLRKDQTLIFNDDIDHENTDAYKKFGIDSGVTLKRTFNPHLSGSTGVNFSISRIEDKSTLERDNYALFSFPQNLSWDTRDNPLDSTKGWLLEGLVSPYVDAFGQSDPFFKTQLGARTFIPVTPKLTLALRGKIGSILGPGTASIPATERYYSGGGGSVRGYGYQDIGPFKNGNPVGGRGLVEASTELRYRITDTIGAVTFLDAGSVSPGVVPDFSKMALGVGVGLRYYTSFGPLRFDVAVPLSQTENASEKYGLYISIGQAF